MHRMFTTRPSQVHPVKYLSQHLEKFLRQSHPDKCLNELYRMFRTRPSQSHPDNHRSLAHPPNYPAQVHWKKSIKQVRQCRKQTTK
ncbi:hypothetical protein C0J52_26832 [Blattella germanica]|nr:hypothetical protein C0J52_26832 [Blattella germanica]